MWPFKKINLKESEIFSGLTDWHSHVLPGVDDGMPDLERSIAFLNEYEKLGVKKLWLTPHVMEDYPNSNSQLISIFETLKASWNGNIELSLASENMLDSLFAERIEKNEFLSIGENNDHLLVETSYFNHPVGFHQMLEGVKRKGYHILLAHPERYRYMGNSDYRGLKELGVKFQLNIMSLTGFYGETAQKKAQWLLDNRLVDVLGSDVHALAHLHHNLEKEIPKKIIDELLRLKESSL